MSSLMMEYSTIKRLFERNKETGKFADKEMDPQAEANKLLLIIPWANGQKESSG